MDINKLEKEIKYRGYRGFIKYNENDYTQWRCAYVAISKENKLYETDYSQMYVNIHGGVTFSEYGNIFAKSIKEKIKPIKPDDWILGIDFAHGGDTIDDWTLENVEKELKHFIDEIIKRNKYEL